MSFLKLTFIFIFLLFQIKVYGASFTFPTTLTADTTGFNLDFSNSWNINSELRRKIHKKSGHENSFNVSANLSF